MKYLSLLAVLLCVSCSSVKHRTFEISAISTAKENIPSIVVVDEEIYKTPDGTVVLTPAKVRVPFEIDPYTGLFKTVNIEVRAVVKDEDGNISRGLAEDDELPFHRKDRSYFHNDPPKLLFILDRNIDY